MSVIPCHRAVSLQLVHMPTGLRWQTRTILLTPTAWFSAR